MSLFFRSAPETRSVTSLPWNYGGDRPTIEGSLEGSLSLVPVYAAVRLVSDSVATLPIQQYLKTTTGRQSLPLPSMFAKPSNSGTRVDWLSRCMTSMLLRGNAYGLMIGSDPAAPGLPLMIEWLNPDKIHWNESAYEWVYQGRALPATQVLHIPAMVLPGCREGVSPMTAARTLVESGKEGQKFQRDWYRNRAVPSVIAKNTARTLDPEVADSAKERLTSTLRSGKPFVTGSDWDITVMQLSADDAGFVTSAKLTATQVASIYGIPAEKIGGEAGGSLTYSTLEQNQIQYVSDGLRSWLVRLEEAFSSLLPTDAYVKFNADALIRADTKTRYEVHQIARTIGLNNTDELRQLEELEPLPDDAGKDYTPLGSGSADSPARLIQQMYLGVGKVITADEARLILKAAGVEIDESVTLDELHQSLPPMPTQEDLAPKP